MIKENWPVVEWIFIPTIKKKKSQMQKDHQNLTDSYLPKL